LSPSQRRTSELPNQHSERESSVSRLDFLHCAGKRVSLVREVVREVSGFIPFERKMLEFIRTGDAAKEKKALRLARARLGTQRRAKAKFSEMERIVQAQKKK
jgi:hypothetical protein